MPPSAPPSRREKRHPAYRIQSVAYGCADQGPPNLPLVRCLTMKQQALVMAAAQEAAIANDRKPTPCAVFLKTMEAIAPWAELCEVIEPHDPKAGSGRSSIGLQRMLRIHFIQHWFDLADLACEDALYDRVSLRRFVGIDPGSRAGTRCNNEVEVLPTAQRQQAGRIAVRQSWRRVAGAWVQDQHRHHRGCRDHWSTEFDQACGQGARSKHAANAHRPAMAIRHDDAYRRRQPERPLAHSAVATAANVPDKHPALDLLHGNESRVYGDSAYASQKKLIQAKVPMPGASRINASATTELSMRLPAPRAATNRESGRGSNTCSIWSSGSGASAKCATGAWPRTPHAQPRRLPWPISTWPGEG